MNNKEFITELAQQTGYTQNVTQTLVRNVIDEMAVRFDEGDVVSIPGFGTFEVKKRLERVVVDVENEGSAEALHEISDLEGTIRARVLY